MPTAKICSTCFEPYPLTTEFFRKRKGAPDGFMGCCKKCAAIRDKKQRDNNSDHYHEYHRKWREDNRDKCNQYTRDWYHRNLEGERARSILKNARDREYKILYYRRRRTVKGDELRARERELHKLNPYPRRLRVQRHRDKKLSLPNLFEATHQSRMMSYFHSCCAYCDAQQSFWNTIEMDHFIPVAMIDKCPGTIPTNMLPACRSCNASKADYLPDEWITFKFGKRKAKQILKRINDYFQWVKEQDGGE